MSWAITCGTVRSGLWASAWALSGRTNSRGRSRSLRHALRYGRSNALRALIWLDSVPRILCRSSEVFLHRQVGEKLADSLLTHLQRMSLVVIEGIALVPIDVGLPSAVGMVLALRSAAARRPGCIPSAPPTVAGQARTLSSSLLGCCVMRVSGNPGLLIERNCDRLLISSAMEPRLLQKISGICKILGKVAELFIMIAQEWHLYREGL